MVEVPVKIYVSKLLKKAREAARLTALLSTEIKDRTLRTVADGIAEQEEAILDANEADVKNVGKTLAGEANKDRVKEAVERVRMTPDTIKGLVDTLRRIADLPDPVGEVTWLSQRPNGMQVSRVRAPIGVVAVISEFGPAVMNQSVALLLKSGNVCVYRPGTEWTHTTAWLAELWRKTANEMGVPPGGITIIERPEKEAAIELFRQPKVVDAVIPKGGPGLRKAVMEQSRVPVLSHDGGINVLYLDADTDLPLAQNLVVNAKVQDHKAVNALDTLLVHQNVARPLLPALVRRLLEEFKVEVRGCPKTVALIGSQSFSSYKSLQAVTEEDWSQQFLSAHLAVKVVMSLDEALDHLADHAPVQTAAIATRDYATAMRFSREADAAAVMINASTRLHDGEELGSGQEIGVSTMRTHARGPIALEQLTCEKAVVMGTGQLRHPHPVPVTYEDAIMLKRPS
ncbi:glutamate-5-semialdehyde dehydrogenase [Candidatus Nitrospira bockiana]